jgi:hypothetical protein
MDATVRHDTQAGEMPTCPPHSSPPFTAEPMPGQRRSFAVRFPVLVSLFALALGIATTKDTAGGARAGVTAHPRDRMPAAMLRQIADHYREVTWTYQRAAKKKRTPTALSYRRSADRRYLQWTIRLWHARADSARATALASVRRRARIVLPAAPKLRAPMVDWIAYHQTVTVRLQKIYRRHTTRASDSFRATHSDAFRRWALHLWQRRAANAALALSTYHKPKPASSTPTRTLSSNPLASSFMCIHRYEGSWTANTGNGFYGGLQMDWSFMSTYGGDFLARWGTADNWPVWAQIETASRAHRSGRGFTPWPNTARYCGLL